MTDKTLIYSFLSLGLIPILPTRMLGLPVVLFVLGVIISIIPSKIEIFKWKMLLLVISPYLLFSLSVLYSENIGGAVRKITETRLSLFIVPLSFSFLNINQLKLLDEKQWLFKKIFVISTFIFCCIYIINLFLIPEAENPSFEFPSGFFFKSALSYIPYIKFEPVSISFVIMLAIIFLSELFNKKKLKMLYFILFILFYIGLIFLMVSKLTIIFLFFYLIWFLFNRTKKMKLRIFIAMGVVFVSFFVTKIPSINYEIREVQYFLKGEKISKDDTTDIRKKITMSSFELAKSTNPLFGIGIGDVQKELNKIYEKRGYNELLERKFGPHNQYLSMYIGTGSIGLFSLILVFVICFKLCIKKKAWYLMWGWLFLFFQMLTESILERQLTVIIFSIIISIILFLPNKRDINNSNVKIIAK